MLAERQEAPAASPSVVAAREQPGSRSSSTLGASLHLLHNGTMRRHETEAGDRQRQQLKSHMMNCSRWPLERHLCLTADAWPRATSPSPTLPKEQRYQSWVERSRSHYKRSVQKAPTPFNTTSRQTFSPKHWPNISLLPAPEDFVGISLPQSAASAGVKLGQSFFCLKPFTGW